MKGCEEEYNSKPDSIVSIDEKAELKQEDMPIV